MFSFSFVSHVEPFYSSW